MNNLDMIKAFAELDGVEIYDAGDGYLFSNKVDNNGDSLDYDPITELALNCAARDKYEAEINYDSMEISVWVLIDEYEVSFNDKYEIPRAVIECILKSTGKWID